jgi:hypothetical protein
MSSSPPLIEGICVVNLQYPTTTFFSRNIESSTIPPKLPEPTFSLILPDGYSARIEATVPQFCFPDIELIRRSPFSKDDILSEEYVFVISSVQKASSITQQGNAPAPKALKSLYGFCRRYRIGGDIVGGRLDLPTYHSEDMVDTYDKTNKTNKNNTTTLEIQTPPAYQVVCILSERPYHRFFSHCLQLLHASRLISSSASEELAKKLIAFSTAPPGSVIPLRSLATSIKSIPGSLGLARERLRLPLNIGLELFDVPISPLLTRLDPQSILLLYAAMLCERRILFVSNSISVLSSSVHAALALLQPFKWQNICIPLIPSKLLDRCCAPMPYIIGLTTEQFTSINDEYELGEIVLVSLDEGYIVALNGSLPLVDFDGVNVSNGNSGVLSYSCPKISSETAAARASVLSGSHGLGFSVSSLTSSSSSSSSLVSFSSTSSVTFSSSMTLSSSSATLSNMTQEQHINDLSVSSTRMDDMSLYSIGKREGSALASIGRRDASGLAASASSIANSITSIPPSSSISISESAKAMAANAAIDSVLSPFHSINRSHSYDEEVVLARAHRLAFINRRIRTRRTLNEKIAMLYMRSLKRTSSNFRGEVKSSASLKERGGRGGGKGGSGGDKRGSLKGLFDEFVDTEVDVSHEEHDDEDEEEDDNEVSSIAAVRASLTQADTTSFATDHAEAGTTNLSIDIHNLVSGRLGARRRPPPRKSAPSTNSTTITSSAATLSPSQSTSSSSMTLTQSIMSATKIGIALATGAPTTDCPAAKLAFELRNIYTKERKEGFFDEAAVYAVFLSFVAIVFGGANSFVTVEGNSEEELVRVLSIVNPSATDKRAAEELYLKLHPRFSKEDFVRLSSIKHSTITRLLDEAMHSQVVYAFICDFYVHAIELRAASSVAAVLTGSSATVSQTGVLVNGKVNIVDIALSEALLRHTKHGSFGKRTSVIGTSTNSGSIGSASSMAQLVSEPPPFTTVHKRLLSALLELYEPIADGASAIGGSNGGVCGSGHSVSSALSSLTYASTCVTANFAKTPQALMSAATGGLGEAHPVICVTALRALVNGLTLAGWKLDEPTVHQAIVPSSSSSLSSSSSSGSAHSSSSSSSSSATSSTGTSAFGSGSSMLSTPLPTALIPSSTSLITSSHAIRLLCAATFDPHLIHIVLGSLWARLNDATSSSSDASRHWQQRFKALGILMCLLKYGSSRVMSLAGSSFLPLLKFFMFPMRPFAVKAGYAAEKLSTNTDTYMLSQSANVFSKSFPTRYSASSLVLIPGLLLCPERHVLFTQEALREGAFLVAQRAAAAYLLIVSPRKWLVERAVTLGPGGTISRGIPLTLPLPFPLVNAAAALVPSSESFPNGWMPTLQQPALPFINSQAVAGDGPLGIQLHGDVSAHPAFPIFQHNAFSPSISAKLVHDSSSTTTSSSSSSSSYPPLEKQPRAALAAFDIVHKRAAPPMASSHSVALSKIASGFTHQEQLWVRRNYRPSYVTRLISEMKSRSEETILAAREHKVKTALFKSLSEACKQPRMADVFIQTKNSTSVVSILDTTLQLFSSSIDIPILSDNHKEITNVNTSVSHLTNTSSNSNIITHASSTMDRPNLAATILSPVPMLSSPTAHVPSPIATIVSSPSLATQVSSPIAVQGSSQNVTLVLSPVIASLIPTAEIVTTTTTTTPQSIIPVNTPRNTSLSIKASNITPGDEDPFGFAQIALQGLEFVSPPAKISSSSSSLVQDKKDDKDDDPFAIFSKE